MIEPHPDHTVPLRPGATRYAWADRLTSVPPQPLGGSALGIGAVRP